MKKILLIILVILNLTPLLFAQRRNNIWQLGGNYCDTCGMGINFNSGASDTFRLNRRMFFLTTDAGICDSFGELLFYTNGIYINNKNNDTLLNSKNFNPGFGSDIFQSQFTGLNIDQAATIIPIPDNDSLYYVFHESWDTFYFNRVNLYAEGTLHLAYSIVNMNLGSGLGGIENDQKDKIILNDTLIKGRLTACKHANGRDWWLIANKSFSNLYYKFLITPTGISGPYTQKIGAHITYDALGESAFSPDGNHFAMMNWAGDTLDVFNFDRCSGDFSINAEIPIIDTFSKGADTLYLSDLGCAFSSNSRFLYANNNLNIYQFDLNAGDIIASKKLVAQWDTTGQQYSYFLTEQLAPDGKIYISQYNGASLTIPYIRYPDSLGTACQFVQKGLAIPFYNIICFPNTLNYDLGTLTGSSCDSTTAINNKPDNWQFKLFPNPVNQWLNIEYQSQENLKCEIFDITGRMVTHFTLYPYFKSRMYDMSGLPAGIYILSARNEKGESVERKIVKEGN